MIHYLNKDLKPKYDHHGNECFPVYYRFTVNRQTFKIKSQIINRPYSDAQFEHILSSSDLFLEKDREIIQSCIQGSISNGLLNINLFKEVYSKSCTSIYYWLQKFIGNASNRYLDEFMYGPNDESIQEQQLVELERRHEIDRFTVLSYLKGYHEYRIQDAGLSKHILIFDWHQGLRSDFMRFYNKPGEIPAQHTQLFKFIDDLITII